MQLILVILAISLALFYLGRKSYKRFFKKESGCDGCGMSSNTQENN